ncbi:SCO family protein [Paraconexibacter algicola]|jgi:protein SCO1|nr:SCO family protein [Paraconexibacter algicola]
MPPRLRLVLVLLLVVFNFVLLGSLLLGDRKDPDETAASESVFSGAMLPAGIRAPDFRLRDEDGAPVTMAGLRGEVVLATFVYSTCDESCGPQLQLIRRALDELGRDIPTLAISADPRTDTAARARRFLLEQRMLGRTRFLLGDADAMSPVYKGFFVQPQTAETEHHARLVLIDRRGFQRVGYTLANTSSAGIAADIRRLQAGS